MALMVAGCGMIEVPLVGFGGGQSEADTLLTGTVSEDGVTDVDPADWKTVQNAISLSFSTLEDGNPTQWSNTDTGSVGSIVPRTAVTSDRGDVCRGFSTTLDTISGLETFDGKACLTRDGNWRITTLTPAVIGEDS